ncbi:MAG TPA: VOC family protein [Puia sp.]|jgi:catechol 2,3-dioxygenase-like lactoylglutathione lyase family enzyme|nr:VOC family protein [Puia sp.]
MRTILLVGGLAALLFSQSKPNKMEPRFTVLTLGVDNLERSLSFYRDGLGFPTKGIIGQQFKHGAIVFFDLFHGMQLALYSRSDLAWGAHVPKSAASPTEFTIGYNVRSKEEVDTLMAAAARAGAKITKTAEKAFWGGYSGYFQDPDGHLWEIVWNPDLIPPRL